MTQLYLKRTMHGFGPADEEAVLALRRIKQGHVVLAEVRQPRNLAQHRKFRALLNTVWAAAGDWPTVEALHDEIKFRTGHIDVQEIRDTDGTVVGRLVKPRSTSFSEMPQAEFDDYMNRAIRVICEDMVPGMESEGLREAVLEAIR